MANAIHQAGLNFAKERIEANGYDIESDWSWESEDGNNILGEEEDWEKYGKHHLGIDEEADEETKDRFAYPFAKIIDGESIVFRSGLVAIRTRSAAEDETEIYDAAGELIEMIDEIEEGEEEEGDSEEGRSAPRESAQNSRDSISTDGMTRSIDVVRAEEIDIEERTIPLVWSTGARVSRWGFEIGEFIEELSLDPNHVRLERLKNGAPLLEQHFGYELDSVLGKVTEAEIKDGLGTGKAKMRSTPKAVEILRDIKDGTLGKLSVGYIVHKFEKVGEEDGVPVLRAVDWEPFEVSVVAIGADDLAEVRSGVEFSRSCEVLGVAKREKERENENDRSHEENTKQNMEIQEDSMDEQTKEAMKKERKRIKEIRNLGREFEISEEKVDKMIEEGTEISAAREAVLKELSEQKKISSNIEVGNDNAREHRQKGMVNAIAARYGQNVKLDEHGKDFRNYGLLDMAREIVSPGRMMTSHELAGRALSTDDFSNILLDSANVTIMDSYKALPKTFEPFVRETTAPNFKNINRTRLSDAPGLEEVLEGEELSYGEMSDEKESYNVKSYGRKLLITRKTIINDDFGEIMRRIRAFGRSANTLDANLVYAILTDNDAMSDGKNLFSSDHSNQITSGAAPSTTQLDKMIALQKKQTSLNGQYIDLPLGVIIVPVALEGSARKLIFGDINAAKTTDANVHSGNFQLVSDPRLDANSAKKWYASVSKAVGDFIELARLQGQEGPMVMLEEKGQSGVAVEAVYDVGVKAIDYRTAVYNAGE